MRTGRLSCNMGVNEMLTKTIAGHKITLVEGRQYMASRPFASRTRKIYPVRIQEIGGEWCVLSIPNLSYDEANELINAFNNDPRGSFYGRVWE